MYEPQETIASTARRRSESPSAHGPSVADRLSIERARLIEALDGILPEDVPSGNTSDEIAAVMPDRDVTYEHRSALFERTRSIDEALERIELGAYGTCTACGDRVGARRLEADPAAALCITCQTAREYGERSFTI